GSGVRGRRVLENASEKKRRLNPLRSQRRNRRRLIDEGRNAAERNVWRMIVVAGGNHRDRAHVIPSICVAMNPLVQLRRSTQRQRPKKSQAKENSANGTVAPAVSHWRRVSVRLASPATSFCAVTSELERRSRISYPTNERCR